MVAARHEDHVAIGHGHGLIKPAVVGIDTLDAKARGGVEAVVIGFLKVGDARKVVFVVAVAWVG